MGSGIEKEKSSDYPFGTIPKHLGDKILNGTEEEASEAYEELGRWSVLTGTEISSKNYELFDESRQNRQDFLNRSNKSNRKEMSFPKRVMGKIGTMMKIKRT